MTKTNNVNLTRKVQTAILRDEKFYLSQTLIFSEEKLGKKEAKSLFPDYELLAITYDCWECEISQEKLIEIYSMQDEIIASGEKLIQSVVQVKNVIFKDKTGNLQERQVLTLDKYTKKDAKLDFPDTQIISVLDETITINFNEKMFTDLFHLKIK